MVRRHGPRRCRWMIDPAQIPGGGKVAQGFGLSYSSIGTMPPGQPGTSAP